MEHDPEVQAAFEEAVKAVIAYTQAVNANRPDNAPAMFFAAQDPSNEEQFRLTVLGTSGDLSDMIGGATHHYPDLAKVLLKASMKSPSGPSQN